MTDDMTNDASVVNLHALMLEAMAQHGLTRQDDATVLAPSRDPYRREQHRDEAEWAVRQVAKLPNPDRIHKRGMHYAALGDKKPDGTVYTNVRAAVRRRLDFGRAGPRPHPGARRWR